MAARGWGLDCGDVRGLVGRADVALVDLRDQAERQRHGVIPGSVHAPYPGLADNLKPGGLLHELAAATGTGTGKRLVFYCAYGERSAMAVQTARDAGLADACHITGGLDAWKRADGPVEGETGQGSRR